MRVNSGGHNIPEEVIRRRYYRGIRNLITKFIKLSDSWIVINNSDKRSTFVAESKEGIEFIIHDNSAWQIIKTTYK
jgi:predicted ABC-type ATPase